jgi:hypothetical protein
MILLQCILRKAAEILDEVHNLGKGYDYGADEA